MAGDTAFPGSGGRLADVLATRGRQRRRRRPSSSSTARRSSTCCACRRSQNLASVGAAPASAGRTCPRRWATIPPGSPSRSCPSGSRRCAISCTWSAGGSGAGRRRGPRRAPAGDRPVAVEAGEIVPRLQDFATVGHLYRSIEAGFRHLAEKYGEGRAAARRGASQHGALQLAGAGLGGRPRLRAGRARHHHRARGGAAGRLADRPLRSLRGRAGRVPRAAGRIPPSSRRGRSGPRTSAPRSETRPCR